jgi:prepilin-type N-terminal cleavage/methylation domain-containing protein
MKRNRVEVRRAFSLLEITLVVLLIGILMAVVAFNVPGYLLRTRMKATWASMRTIKTALVTYSGFNGGQYPPSLAVLQQGTAPLIDPTAKLQDAWNNAFIYAPSSPDGQHPYSLYSKGPNGVFESGGGDDLDIWKEPTE